MPAQKKKKRYCDECGKELNKDEIGASQKLLGRNTMEMFCLDCLAEYIGTPVEDILCKIEEWKEEGCQLF